MVSRLVNRREEIQTARLVMGNMPSLTSHHQYLVIPILRMFYRDLRLETPLMRFLSFCCLLTVNQSEIFAVCSHSDSSVTKQIFRPTEFFPVTITDNHRQSLTNPYGCIFVSFWLLEPCSAVLQHYKQIVIVLIKFCPLHTWSDWVWVGGDGWYQTRYLTALSSHILQISDPRSDPRSSNNPGQA